MTPFQKPTCWISFGNSFEKLYALHVIFICIFVAKRYQKHCGNPKTRQFTVGDNPLITFFINGAAWEWIRVNIKVVKHETSANYSVKWEKQMKMFISFPGILMRNDIAFWISPTTMIKIMMFWNPSAESPMFSSIIDLFCCIFFPISVNLVFAFSIKNSHRSIVSKLRLINHSKISKKNGFLILKKHIIWSKSLKAYL